MDNQSAIPTNEYTDEQFRLIIVEDDFVIYKTMKFIINKHFPMIRIVGHCESVEEVVALVGTEKPDVLLLDIQLRGGTSFQALAEIPERTFDCIVMSAQAQFHYAQEAMRYGASEYLVKPFLPEEMIAALKTVLDKRRARISQKGTAHLSSKIFADVNTFPETTALRGIIVDDEKTHRFTLRKKITDIFQRRIEIVAEAFSVDSAVAVIHNNRPDIVFLDIDIIGGTGFDVLDIFPERTFEVILVSSYPQFGPQAFRYKALDYILKPIEEEHLARAIERVFSARGMNKETLEEIKITEHTSSPSETTPQMFIPQKPSPTSGFWTFKALQKTLYSLAWEQIIHLKADDKYTIVYHTDGKPLTVPRTLQECLKDLPSSLFYQTHRSHAINRKHFSHARDGFAFMSNGDRVDVATRLWKQFLIDMGST